ncbi:hypothetical protein [Anianabacter salinae]|uniref:hypothetical protein n=1 Tax=Anianabacter salinae TaxID=2851023 RepID=UPI00225E6081|nr:hypothetical protein [Anianabacter salinae]MBV0912802.1 hypothetical protein [Anianabacter salinae]
MTDRVLARLDPTIPRRVLGLGMLTALAASLVFVAMDTPDMPGLARAVMASAGAALVIVAALGWQATSVSLELTEDTLRTSGGDILCRLQDIERIERGAFAFKPSGGFVLLLKVPGPARWAPGLWWRMGTRLGVGGLVPPAMARAMADAITERTRVGM